MKRTNIHLTENQLLSLASQSKLDGLPIAEHIRRAIDKYIKEKKIDNRRNMEQIKSISQE